MNSGDLLRTFGDYGISIFVKEFKMCFHPFVIFSFFVLFMFNIFVIWGESRGFPNTKFDKSLNDFWGDLIEQLFWGSFGLPRILGNVKGRPLDFRGFQRIPGISQDFGGFYRILLIFGDLCAILGFADIWGNSVRPFPWIPWTLFICSKGRFRGFRGFRSFLVGARFRGFRGSCSFLVEARFRGFRGFCGTCSCLVGACFCGFRRFHGVDFWEI